ncbi:MAG: DUF2188 domain-containing protein [Candidatus Omnitrophota bacterium]
MEGKRGVKEQDRMVYYSGGKWYNKQIGEEGEPTTYDNAEEAIKEARHQLGQAGGGELTIKGEDGRIRNKETINAQGELEEPEEAEGEPGGGESGGGKGGGSHHGGGQGGGSHKGSHQGGKM